MTMWTPTELADLKTKTQALLSAGVRRDATEVVDLIEYVGSTYGSPGVFGVCCAMGSVIRRVAFSTLGEDEMVGVFSDDEPVSPRMQATLFAARFAAAYINRDKETYAALFYAAVDAVDADQAFENVIALVAATASVVRHVERAAKAASN